MDEGLGKVLHAKSLLDRAWQPCVCAGPGPSSSQGLDDGPGKYELVGLISHMGSNLGCGHYVCHLRKQVRF